MDRSLMAAASDLTSQPKDKEEVIVEAEGASEEVVDTEVTVTVEVEVALVEAVDTEVIVIVAEVLAVAAASVAIGIVEEASVAVRVEIVTEAEGTEFVHFYSELPIRKFWYLVSLECVQIFSMVPGVGNCRKRCPMI